jgi:YHS domain-containing protein
MPKKYKDIICGIMVDENTDFASEYEGKKYYFCSKKCKELFDSGPEYFVKLKKEFGA